MGSIPGPVLTIRIDQATLSGSVSSAMNQVRETTRQISKQAADDWAIAAAKIRSSMATGIASDKEVLANRKELISLLQNQLKFADSITLKTKEQLTWYKQVTLELERQNDAMKRGVGVGVTRGTSSALGQLSGQTLLGFERILDSVVNRYLGGAAGAATRLLRDVTYYGGVAGGGGIGGAAAGGGVFAGLKGGYTSLVETIGPTTLAIGGATAAIAAQAAIVSAITKGMIEYAQAIRNVASETGLSVVQVQQFKELAKITGVDADGLANAFGRLQAQLGKYVVSGKESDKATESFVQVMTRFNIAVTTSTGGVRPIDKIMGDFAQALSEISDPATRSAVAMDAMGIRGKVLVQVIDNARASGLSLKQALDRVAGVALPESQINQLLREKEAWDKISVAIDQATIHLKGFIATHPKELSLPGGLFGLAYEGARDALNPYLNPNAPGRVLPPSAADAQAEIQRVTRESGQRLLEQAQILLAGSKEQFQIEKDRKELTEAIAGGYGTQAFALASEIKSLEEIVKNEKERAAAVPKYKELLATIPSIEKQIAQAREKYTTLVREFSGGPTGGKYGPFNALGGGTLQPPSVSGTIVETPALLNAGFDAFTKAGNLLKQIADEHDDLFTTQLQKDREHYEEEAKELLDSYQKKLISQQQYQEASRQLQEDWQHTLNDLNKKYADEAGKLFDDLVAGKTKDFARSLGTDIRNIFLAPIKSIFEQQIGGVFGGLSRLAGAPFQGIQQGGLPGGGLAGLLSHIPGIGSFFRGGVGSSPKGTPTDPVFVTFGGVGGIGGGGIGPGGTAGTFPGTISIPGVGSIPLAPFINAFSSSGGAAGFDTTGTGFGTPSGFSISGAFGGGSGGGFSLSRALGGGFGGSLAAGGVTAGASIGGGLLLGAGSRRGGALGGLEGPAGGALEGAAAGLVAGPIGAAVGAIIGGIGGLISGILGGPNFGQRVSRDMWLNAYHAPPSETFSFASNGSIANTLSTGFSQSGNQFGKFTLPANTPFYASAITGPLTARQQLLLQQEYNNLGGNQPFGGFNPNPFAGTGIPSIGGQTGPEANAIVGNRSLISGSGVGGDTHIHFHVNTIDQKGVSDFFNENHEKIGAILAARGATSSASQWGSRVRAAVNPP